MAPFLGAEDLIFSQNGLRLSASSRYSVNPKMAMIGPRRPKRQGLSLFWDLLTAIEQTTQLELAAIKERNLDAIDVFHEAKIADFARLQSLGGRMGITRENAELDSRLTALARAEARNAEAAGAEARVLRLEWEQQGIGSQRLSSLKRAYASDVIDSEFHAEG